jgi:SAM-dependent methyltransferase
MKHSLLDVLRCPACKLPLALENAKESGGEIETGSLRCAKCNETYPVVGFIPRFVPADNYANNFGFQWNAFRQTQLDTHSGVPISRNRFLAQTNWNEQTLTGKRVLDAGCGAGRFAQIALSLGAEVFAIDYSSAVDAAWKNLAPHPRLHLIQADIYRLPFAPATFDFVYSLGVLQHTPDVKAAFMALPPLAKPGGGITVDLYLKTWRNVIQPRYYLRWLTTRMPQPRLFSIIQRTAPALMKVSRAVSRVPVAGKVLRRAVPVANYTGVLPLSEQQLLEWAILDTFDWFAPAYDQPQTPATLRRWMEEAGLRDVHVEHIHHLTGRGVRA